MMAWRLNITSMGRSRKGHWWFQPQGAYWCSIVKPERVQLRSLLQGLLPGVSKRGSTFRLRGDAGTTPETKARDGTKSSFAWPRSCWTPTPSVEAPRFVVLAPVEVLEVPGKLASVYMK